MAHHGYNHTDLPSSYMSLASAKNFGPPSFNFKDLAMHQSMKRSNSDYFSMRPVRGSSPTASLAADLSQNFHIDQRYACSVSDLGRMLTILSPQLPTPRRALFSNNMFNGRYPGMLFDILGLYGSNSNASCHDHSASTLFLAWCHRRHGHGSISLPHKAPFHVVELELQSPTPELTPVDASMLSIPSPPSSDSLLDPPQLTLPTEKKKGPLRPLLSRAKGLSTSSIPQQPAPESQLPAFKFGNYSTKPAASSSLSLSEIFESSPVQERQPAPRPAAPAMALPRPRQPFSGFANPRNGSPIGQHVRKMSNPLVRPRKQFRRSLSMYEHPEDIIKQEKEAPPPLPCIMDVEAVHVPKLPHFVSDRAGDLPRITKDTMVSILDGNYDHLYEKRVVIDCRFEYEYSGGHIDGAVNFNDKEQLGAQLFDLEPTEKALLIFHCEYSAHRAPLMAKFIRNKDRTVNAERYPGLTYPEAYILDGGYSQFFKDHQARCFPQNYVEMDAKEHEAACERGLGKVKHQQRTKLMRAQTFAFGQHSPTVDSSPTAMGRSRVDDDIDMSLDYTPLPAARPTIDMFRRGNQRMFSY